MRTVSLILVLVLSGIASAADKPKIDSVVAAAWGFSATPAVQLPEAMPSYRLYQDARGVWYQVPVQTPAVEVGGVRPFQPDSNGTNTTIAPVAATSRRPAQVRGSSGATSVTTIYTSVPGANSAGGTNCIGYR